jgi:hypothetical protein
MRLRRHPPPPTKGEITARLWAGAKVLLRLADRADLEEQQEQDEHKPNRRHTSSTDPLETALD